MFHIPAKVFNFKKTHLAGMAHKSYLGEKFMLRLTAVFLLIMHFACIAEDIPFVKKYDLENGLLSSRVYCALQDAEGYVWFGTDAGISRFDGHKFVNFSIQDGLPALRIIRIFEDSKKRLWFLSSSGKIGYYFKRTFFTEKNDSLLRSVQSTSGLYAIAEDQNQNIWFSNEQGEITGILHSNETIKLNLPVKQLPVYPDFYLPSGNELWVITEDRFYLLENAAFTALTGPEILSEKNLVYHFISRGNALYLSSNGLERLINKNYGLIIPEKKLPFMRNSSRIYYSANNDIWISDGESVVGWLNYEKGGYSPFRLFSKDVRANSFYNDNENNIWICTDGKGAIRVSSQYVNTTYYTRADGLTGSNAASVLVDRDSRIWIGFNNGSICNISSRGVEEIKYVRESKHNIHRIVQDRAGNIWAFSTDYFLFIRKTSKTNFAVEHVIKPRLPYSEEILSAEVSDDFVYFFTSSSAWKVTATPGIKFTPLEIKTSGNREFLYYQKLQEISVLACKAGIFRGQADSLIPLTTGYEFLFPVTGIQFSSDSTLIIATKGSGILIFHNGMLAHHFVKSETFDFRFINGMIKMQEVYYAATNNGLLRFIISGKAISAIEHFNTGDGLISDVVNALCADSTYLYLAGDEGLTVLPLSIRKKLVEAPPVYINSVIANETEHTQLDSLRFPYRNLRLKIIYSAPTFDRPDLISYQYRLTGLADDWTEAHPDEMELSLLDPGNYIFQVRAKKYNSEWSKPQVIKFEVIAPFYGTLWFRLLIANSLIFLLYLFLRDFVGRKFRHQLALYERQQVVENERNRISKDMHDDLGADLTNIVILSKIARKTIKPRLENADAIDQIEVAANDVINKMNEIIWALNPSNDSLFNLITYVHRFAREYLELSKINISVMLPETIPQITVSAAFRRNVFLVVKEMLHNIVKHSAAKNVTIRISLQYSAHGLLIEIKDDGRGFEVESRIGSGNGLLNVQKRMKEIKGSVLIRSKPGSGTDVHIEAPYSA